MVPPHSSQIFVYANSSEKLLQDFCPFCIFFICLNFLDQYTTRNFLIYHFGVRIPVPDKWVFLRSSLYTIWQNITMSSYFSEFALFFFFFFFFLLYTIFIIPLCSCKFLGCYVSNLVSWKIFVNDFTSMVNIPFCYIFIFQQITFSHNVF